MGSPVRPLRRGVSHSTASQFVRGLASSQPYPSAICKTFNATDACRASLAASSLSDQCGNVFRAKKVLFIGWLVRWNNRYPAETAEPRKTSSILSWAASD